MAYAEQPASGNTFNVTKWASSEFCFGRSENYLTSRPYQWSKMLMFGAGKRSNDSFPPRAPVTVFFPKGDPVMKPRGSSRPDPTQKKTAQFLKTPGGGKVWVNPKSHLKITCAEAWSQAEVPSPKFIDMGQIDMRAKKPPERPKGKAGAAGGKSRTPNKSPRK